MSAQHKTIAGNVLHAIGQLFSHLLGHNNKITVQSIVDHAPDILKVTNFYNGLATALHGLTDPVDIANAVCKYALAHEKELPDSMLGGEFEQTLIDACTKESTLPLATVEAIVKGYLKTA